MYPVPTASPYFYHEMSASDSIRIFIYPISEQHHNGKLLGYSIIYQDACSRNTSAGHVNVSILTTSYTITGLKPGTQYDIRVAAFNSRGTGPYYHRTLYTSSKCIPVLEFHSFGYRYVPAVNKSCLILTLFKFGFHMNSFPYHYA